METTLKVTGMNCGACVNHVTNALQGVEGVTSAAVDLESGTATVKHEASVQPQTLVEAVEEDGYGAELAA
jgi:copper chaperone CopZ